MPEFSGWTVVLAEIRDRHLRNRSAMPARLGMKNEEYTLLFLFVCLIKTIFPAN